MQAESGTLRRVRHKLTRLWREDHEPSVDEAPVMASVSAPASPEQQHHQLDGGVADSTAPARTPSPTSTGRVNPRQLLRHVLHHRSLGGGPGASSIADSCSCDSDELVPDSELGDEHEDATDEDADEHDAAQGQGRGDRLLEKLGQKLRHRSDRMQKCVAFLSAISVLGNAFPSLYRPVALLPFFRVYSTFAFCVCAAFLTPQIALELCHKYFQRNSKLSDVNRRLKSQIWSSVVTIVLVEGRNLLPMNMEGTSDPYCKFRLGQEKYKSKVAYGTLSPSWLEQFDLHMYDDQSQELEVTLWDKERSKDDCIGRQVSGSWCTIDLSLLERESTHRIRQAFDNGAGSVFLLLTISGTTASETISDLTTYEENPRERLHVEQRYGLLQSFNNLRDVGHLTVKVFRAQGLAAADLGGKSDPFCVLELVNARLQTQTEYKTLAPQWNKIFTFNVKDINSVLEITVYDEDRDHKVEFLGKLAIPLIRVRSGEKRWYCLKDKNLTSRAKGNNPQILLEMTVIWNQIRASIRTINPKEKKYMQSETKFKRQVFLRNVMRLKTLIMCVIDFGKYLQSCFEWESTPRSIIALVLFIPGCYYFEPYMIAVGLLCVFLKYYIVLSLTGGWGAHDGDDDLSGDEDSDDDDKEKEGKMSLKERLHAIQEVTQTVQNSIGHIASLGESIKNTFNFTVPFLSYIAIIMLILAAIVLYWIPARYLIMGWGINKFARKIVRPHTVPNNEVLDLLSRVPDDMDLISYRELKPHNLSESERRRDQRKKHKVN
ncbi:Multiple C2 and transmembrane domain-containing protein [Frankliniella fusca]|uniref:Multiple C2 and transmembrane domain-containing protein n=1 Tax=Frankliniella fusca TaxID=407009 RepID=A0AAE1LD28_9NEOP|nr:Multiple C2 and transmembrane domain-containing protein [Frankliniella fusca]